MTTAILFYVLAIFAGIVLYRTTDSQVFFSVEKALLFGASKSETYFELENETDHSFQIALVCVVCTITWTTKNA